ncbi:MAG: tyrosine-type recombinase/integrase [Boseongicola sp. SB0675_bin_26]|nr:tyrosine-type recombinase/integrase [Gammaproteobacteria bacterium]MYH57694.1 tyrosine-type recombinase/integrase [Boseongicola sp. SB0675_bin_26]
MAARKRMRLTDAGIARLRPGPREFTVWDSRVPGLGVRVRPNGGMSYVMIRTVGGRTRRVSLGPVALRSVDDVRRECLARQAEAAVAGPAEPARESPTFADFVEGAWQAAHRERHKPSTRKRVLSALRTHLLPAFGTTRLDRITRAEVERWFDACSRTAPGSANWALDLLRQILNFGIACGHARSNPAHGVRRNRRTPMTRFLSREEVRRLNAALDAASMRGPSSRQQADMLRLLMLTGCRKGEILSLRWSEVDGDMLALADSKTGPRTVHLNPQARAVLDRQPRGPGPYVFPSPGRPDRPRSDNVGLWHKVRREAGIEDVRLHDLRHNYASWAVMQGVPVPVVSRLLGHSSARMTLRYVHLADRDVRAAAERVGAAMARLMDGEPA